MQRLERQPGGHFRGWLSKALRTFAVNQWRYERRARRDVRRNVALGDDGDEHAHPLSSLIAPRADPVRQTERNRALTLLSDAVHTLELEYCRHARASGADGARRFELAKRAFLPGVDYEMLSLEACATELNLSMDATKQLVGRLRKRYLALRDRLLCLRVCSDLAEAKRWLYWALETTPPAPPEA